ncbi:MAG TPA: HD domain-containing protein [Verrucomicrobiae bacterium]|nr:HD domain-containing protein [Verrucomicrobiae bacterium]
MSETTARDEALAFMRELELRPVHVEHVARLATQLFDQLLDLHGLGSRERVLLEAAAWLHDIGQGQDPLAEGHHKRAARLIRERPWVHFSPPEVELIAQVARYHRKAMPQTAHDEFRALDSRNRRTVQCLAALLRLADSLDRSHHQAVREVRVEIRPNQLLFHLDATGPILREVTAVHAKGDLAIAVFQRDLVFLAGNEVITPGP